MDSFTFVAIAVLVIIIAFFLLTNPKFPDLPGPSVRDYLPGGLVHKIYTDPTAMLAVLSRLVQIHGEVFQMRLGPTRMVVVSAPADLAHVLSNSDDFVRPPSMNAAFESVVPGSLFTMHLAEHFHARRCLRAYLNHSLLPHFHAPMVDAVREIIPELRAAAEKHADAGKSTLVAPSYVDINNLMETVSMRIVLNVALGGNMTLTERKKFAHDVDKLFAEVLREFTEYPLRQALTFTGVRSRMFRTRARIHAVAQRLVDDRLAETEADKKGRAPDLLDAILELDNHDTARRMSEVSTFVLGGTHTVGVGIAWALFHLCTHPQAAAKLEAEVDGVCRKRGSDVSLSSDEVLHMRYLRNVWKETLRLTPAVYSAIRMTSRDVTLRGSGVKLPKGTQVDALFCMGQRSERYFADANEFVPERWGTEEKPGEAERAPAGAFLPYGAGQRGCAGQFFANYESPLVLAELVRHFRFELACPADEIRGATGFVEAPRWSSKRDGKVDMGIPLIVTER